MNSEFLDVGGEAVIVEVSRDVLCLSRGFQTFTFSWIFNWDFSSIASNFVYELSFDWFGRRIFFSLVTAIGGFGRAMAAMASLASGGGGGGGGTGSRTSSLLHPFN